MLKYAQITRKLYFFISVKLWNDSYSFASEILWLGIPVNL